MFNLIFGFVIVWLILSSAILIHLKIKERRDIQQQIRQVAQTFNTTPELVLFLDYTSPDFKEIDELLLSETPVSFVVVFRAPIWLIEVKKKKNGLPTMSYQILISLACWTLVEQEQRLFGYRKKNFKFFMRYLL